MTNLKIVQTFLDIDYVTVVIGINCLCGYTNNYLILILILSLSLMFYFYH